MSQFASRQEPSDLVREVYTLAGEALSQAQYFERALVNHLARVMLNRRIHTKSDWDALMATLDQKTCGQLLYMVSTLGLPDEDLPIALRRARDERNALVHGFFYYHGMDMVSDEGIERIKTRLSLMIDAFGSAVSQLDSSSTLLRGRLGLSKERIDQEITEMLKFQDR